MWLYNQRLFAILFYFHVMVHFHIVGFCFVFVVNIPVYYESIAYICMCDMIAIFTYTFIV